MVASGGDKAFIKHNLSRLQSIQSNLGQKSSILQGMIETFFSCKIFGNFCKKRENGKKYVMEDDLVGLLWLGRCANINFSSWHFQKA